MSHASPRDDSFADAAWADGDDPEVLPQDVREAFPALGRSGDEVKLEVKPLAGGLLHRSFHLRAGNAEFVLQQVNDVFAPEIHDNIQAVSTHLAARGVVSARLLPNRSGDNSAIVGSKGRWRLMPHLGGASFDRLESVDQARSAGHLVGRFHAAMRDFDRPLADLGIPYRDTPRYLAAMQRALSERTGHRLAAPMRELADRVEEQFEAWGEPPPVPKRVIHGDLKLTNLLFESATPPGRDVAFALVDLDTLMRAPLWIELGDAWRSWCNVDGGDVDTRDFDLGSFEASLDGFLAGHAEPLFDGERDSLVLAPERIALELCSRFVTDAVLENYFAWDETRYSSRGEHNAHRALEQWSLFESMRDCRDAREAILRSAA